MKLHGDPLTILKWSGFSVQAVLVKLGTRPHLHWKRHVRVQGQHSLEAAGSKPKYYFSCRLNSKQTYFIVCTSNSCCLSRFTTGVL